MTGASLIIHNEPLSVTPAFTQTHKQERLLDSLRMGLVTRKTSDQGKELPAPPTHLLADGHFEVLGGAASREAWRGAPCPDLACVPLPSGYSQAASFTMSQEM